MRKPQADWQQLGTITTDDRRREDRIPLALTIEVCGFDCSLRFFTECTETFNVSDSGCQFRLRMQVAPESVLAIRVIHQNGDEEMSSKSALFRVVRVRQDSQATLIGAQKLQPHSLWNLGIPRLN
ncbi:MAG TPA: PilZ domain-containing protein [Candidatus Acidoferrales bacterium]|nr:PilZ domain-containing protein [Candidatus Acidoferrales bacterium]